MMFRLTTLSVAVLCLVATDAFAPMTTTTTTTTALQAVNRREAVGAALGFLMGAASMESSAQAASNPALESWRSKPKSQSFYPVGESRRK